jgi:DNA-binding transcriptional regulator YhcF (GntR family)
VCEQILLKEWSRGDKIPSVRDLAVSLQVNPNTVARAYVYLEEQGVISTQRGLGYFVADNARKNILALKKVEFTKTQLPQLFKMMDLLEMDMGDLKKLHQVYLKTYRP